MPILALGVLAPNARLRKQVVPEAPEGADLNPCGHSVAYAETRNGRTIRRRWVPWAQFLLKVFSVDVMICPKCNSRMQRIAVIQQPSVIAAIFDCLSRKERPPRGVDDIEYVADSRRVSLGPQRSPGPSWVNIIFDNRQTSPEARSKPRSTRLRGHKNTH